MKGPARWTRTAQIKNGQGLGDILGSVLGNSLRGSMEATPRNKARKMAKAVWSHMRFHVANQIQITSTPYTSAPYKPLTLRVGNIKVPITSGRTPPNPYFYKITRVKS